MPVPISEFRFCRILGLSLCFKVDNVIFICYIYIIFQLILIISLGGVSDTENRCNGIGILMIF